MMWLRGLVVILIIAVVYGLPNTLLKDVKQAELNKPRPNKVKRAQEVIMFGNQQNRAGDGRNNYARADKRGEMEEPLGVPAMEEIAAYPVPLMPLMRENDLDIEPPRALPFRQSAYLYDAPEPYYTDYRYLGDRRKRNSPSHSRLSRNSRVFRSARSPIRAKRDTTIDPEDLFTLLALWETERRNNQRYSEHPQHREYINYPAYDPRKLNEEDEENNEISDGEDLREDSWLDGPVKLPAHKFISQDFAYPEWTPALMHQQKQNKESDKVRTITELLENAPVHETNLPVQRRFML